jgi:hypothetical protein
MPELIWRRFNIKMVRGAIYMYGLHNSDSLFNIFRQLCADRPSTSCLAVMLDLVPFVRTPERYGWEITI